jgi:hypothetical protein
MQFPSLRELQDQQVQMSELGLHRRSPLTPPHLRHLVHVLPVLELAD